MMLNNHMASSVILGIDYSMTCPAACVWSDTPQFWFAQQRRYTGLPAQLTHTEITTTEMLPRAEALATALMSWIEPYSITTIGIEDYAFAATGRVFHIGEHTGILKYLLWKHPYRVQSIPPTVVKKFATGKGNADKPKMTAAFLADYPAATAWIPLFFPRATNREDAVIGKSPMADLADAYWLAKYTASLTR